MGELAESQDDLASEEEVEIVLEGEEETPTSQSVPKGFLRRIDKLNARNQAKDEENERLRQENELLKLSQQQKPTRPRRDDFDTDDDFEEALDEYRLDQNRRVTEKIVDERFQSSQKDDAQSRQQQTRSEALEAHYGRAEKLSVSDYEEAEDKAIEVLGKAHTAEIIASLDKSELVMYHLGKNPAKAREIADLLQSNPVKGTLALGRLEAQLKLKPRTSRQPAPETEVEGGSPAGESNYEKKLDKLRSDVAAGKKDMSEILAFKKAHRKE